MFRNFVPAFSRGSIIALAALAMLGSATVSATAEKAAFTPSALQAAQAAHKSIVVHVTASWCSTCRWQKYILDDLAKEEKFKNYVFLIVDFDSQKDVVRSLRARSQSTLIVYWGKEETGRSAGDTNSASIEALLSTAQ
jgi:thiol:disulfide interchange protein